MMHVVLNYFYDILKSSMVYKIYIWRYAERMSKNYDLDENGCIKDTDPLYDTLDEWHDNDEYDKILEAIRAIPREQWSNKLWFRVVSALNNKEDFDAAREELHHLGERCQTPADRAKYYYMLGYMFYKTDKEYKAIECYQAGIECDPEDTAELSLQNECDDCREYINQGLTSLTKLSEAVAHSIDQRISENPDKKDIDENTFTMALSFIPSIRKITPLNKCLGIDNLFFKYDDTEKETVKEFLNIPDKEALKEILAEANYGGRFNDILAAKAGNPPFSLDQLNASGRILWNASMDYADSIMENIPEGGLCAWDISEKIALARHAFACDLITNSEYMILITALTDEAKEKYHSWAEYLTGLALGAGYFMFCIDDLCLSGAFEFTKTMATMVLNSILPDFKWFEK